MRRNIIIQIDGPQVEKLPPSFEGEVLATVQELLDKEYPTAKYLEVNILEL